MHGRKWLRLERINEEPKEKEREVPVPGRNKFSLGLKVPQIQSPHLELVHREFTEPDTSPTEDTVNPTVDRGKFSRTCPPVG